MTTTVPPDASADDRRRGVLRRRRRTSGSSRTSSSCASRRSRRCREHAPGHGPRGASGSPRRCAGSASSTSRSRRRRATRSSTRDWLHAAGRADDPRLLPLRRAAGRPDRAVGDRAVRAVRQGRPRGRAAARPTTRASCTCTSRPPRRSSRRAAGCRSTCGSCSRARRSRRVGEPAGLARGEPGAARRRRRRHQRHGLLRGQRARRSRPRCGACCTPRSTSSASPIDLHSGGFGGGRPEPGERAGPDHHRAQGRRRDRPRARASTTTSSPTSTAGALRDQLPAVRRGGVPGADRRAGARRRRARLHASSSAWASGRRSTSTASGAASRARARRRSSRPTPTPRSAAGSCPTRTARRCSTRFRDYVLEVAPKGVDRRGPEPRHGQAAAHRPEPPGRAGRGARARGDVRAGAGLHPVRRQHPGRVAVRHDARAARRHARLHQSGRQRACSERDDGPLEL